MISDEEYKLAIININHSSDNMKECLLKGFSRVDEQHKSLLEEMKDQKNEMILLRTQTNRLIKSINKSSATSLKDFNNNNVKVLLAMIGVVTAAIGIFAYLSN